MHHTHFRRSFQCPDTHVAKFPPINRPAPPGGLKHPLTPEDQGDMTPYVQTVPLVEMVRTLRYNQSVPIRTDLHAAGTVR